MEKKYIVIDKRYAVAFCCKIEHVDEANKRNATSAGFYRSRIDGNGELQVEVYGESNSLGGLKPNYKLDPILLKNLFI